MRGPIRYAVALAGLLAVMPPARAGAAVEERPIQPGAQISSPVGGCTLNFIFRDPQARLHAGTAGHCAVEGDRISTGGSEFGTVVFRHHVGNDDFALIRIDPDRYDDVSPRMRTWGGPTGVTTPVDTPFAAFVLHHGYGAILGSNEVTRPRRGLLWYDDARYYRAASPIVFGDSGGPVLDEGSGKALGLVSNLGGGMLEGPTIARALQLAASAGYVMAIVPAAYPA